MSTVVILFQYDLTFSKDHEEKSQMFDTEDNRTLNITKKLMFSKPKIIEDREYIKVEVENSNAWLMEVGKPRLPVYSIIMEFPLGTEILNISYQNTGVNEIPLKQKIMMAPLPFSTKIDLSSIIQKAEEEKYKDNDIPYPDIWYSYDTGGGLSDNKHVTFLTIYLFPIRYISSEDTLQYINEAEINILYKEGNKILDFEPKYDLLIITSEKFVSNLNRLIEHKNQIDINTTLVTIGEIYNDTIIPNNGIDGPEKIKYFIKDSIENWGVKYVLFVGDKDTIEARSIHIMLPSSIPLPSFSDMYYMDIFDEYGNFSTWDINNNKIFAEYNWEWNSDSLDFYPDVYVGRLPCENKEEVSIVVDKIINYEKNNDKKDWLNNIIVCAGDTFLPRTLAIRIPLVPSLKLKDLFIKEGEFVGDKIGEIMQGFNVKKLYSSQIIPLKNKKPLTHINIAREVNKGASFVLFNGHGNYDTWATHKTISLFRLRPINGFTTKDIPLFNNKDKLPVFLFSACLCGGFTEDKNCLAWNPVKSEKGGSIASFGFIPSVFGYLGEENILLGLNSYMDLSFFQSYKNGVDIIGELMVSTLNDYLHFHTNMNSVDFYNLESWVLFGDPSLKIGGYSTT